MGLGRGRRSPARGDHAGRRRLSAGASKRSPRAIAVAVLRDIERREGFSNRVLSEHLERARGLSGRDRGLVTHLVYGVLRHRTRLDRHIDARADRPGKIKGEVRTVLRVAALELRELGHPPHAAISEAVRVVSTLDRSGRLKGLVQAIASGIDREGAALDATMAASKPRSALVDRWSIPSWLAKRWVAELGPERALLRAEKLSVPPRVDVRVVMSKLSRNDAADRLAADHPGATIERPEAHPEALRVQGAGDLFYGPLFDAGALVVQGLASAEGARMLGVRPGERVLDACAGMGGKTRQLAEAIGGGRLVASDADAGRLQQLRATIARHHPDTELHVVHGDVSAELPELQAHAPFDAVLLDAPCTGLGNLARHPEIRWVRSPADLADRRVLQTALLRRCLARVRPGGRLVYAVCSPEPDEGPDIVRAVCSDPDVPRRPSVTEERHRTPEHDDTEGFYTARLDLPG
ncbi:MAG: transcription antitermination factor NusB [Myxococcota bacterium]